MQTRYKVYVVSAFASLAGASIVDNEIPYLAYNTQVGLGTMIFGLIGLGYFLAMKDK